MKEPKLLIVLSGLIFLSGVMTFAGFFLKTPPPVEGTSIVWYTPIIGALYILAGAGALKLQNWARWIILLTSAYFIVKTPWGAYTWYQRFRAQAGEAQAFSIGLYACISAISHGLFLYLFGFKWKTFYRMPI